MNAETEELFSGTDRWKTARGKDRPRPCSTFACMKTNPHWILKKNSNASNCYYFWREEDASSWQRNVWIHQKPRSRSSTARSETRELMANGACRWPPNFRYIYNWNHFWGLATISYFPVLHLKDASVHILLDKLLVTGLVYQLDYLS